MPDANFRVIAQDDLFAVEMVSESGNVCFIPDFRTKREADAWVFQTKRMLYQRDPRHKVVHRVGNH